MDGGGVAAAFNGIKDSRLEPELQTEELSSCREQTSSSSQEWQVESVKGAASGWRRGCRWEQHDVFEWTEFCLHVLISYFNRCPISPFLLLSEMTKCSVHGNQQDRSLLWLDCRRASSFGLRCLRWRARVIWPVKRGCRQKAASGRGGTEPEEEWRNRTIDVDQLGPHGNKPMPHKQNWFWLEVKGVLCTGFGNWRG
jgi:hypothetical protein